MGAWAPHVLCAIVGVSAWIEVNALFSELGVMKNLPEGRSLSSIIVLLVQIGNIFPLLFSLIPRKPDLRWSMLLVLSLGIASLVFLSIFWDQTYIVFGEERSFMLYVGGFIAAGADCLSNIVFWPYVGQFPRSYITAMGTGESLSSAISAIVVTSQKAIGFSPSWFFVVILVVVVLSSAAFVVLETKYASNLIEEARVTSLGLSSPLPVESGDEKDGNKNGSWREEIGIYAIIAGIAFVQNGLNPSLLPFACKGYADAYWISQNALFVASPVMSISASFFKPRKSIVPAVICWLTTSIIVIIAAANQSRFVENETTGTILTASVFILSGASLAYSKVSAMLWLRSKEFRGESEKGSKSSMKRLMTVAGISMQVGSVCGAVSMFLLIQVEKEMSRKRVTGDALTQAVMKRGLEPVNSDEEHNMVLDETQQEKFISEMNLIATQYIATWRKMFAWTSLLILYVHALSLLGLVPLTRGFLTHLTPQSVTFQLLLSPAFAGSAFFSNPLFPIMLEVLSLSAMMWTIRECLKRPSLSYPAFSSVNKLVGFLAFLSWALLSYVQASNSVWGRHLVLTLSIPLHCLAAETFRGAREMAKEGVDKLDKLKYSHKKV